MCVGNQAWLASVSCIAAALVVVLAGQNATLRETLRAYAAQPRVGDWVPSHAVARLDDTPLTLGGSTTTAAVFLPSAMSALHRVRSGDLAHRGAAARLAIAAICRDFRCIRWRTRRLSAH